MKSYENIQADGIDVLLINPPYPRRYGGGLVPPIGLAYLAASLREAGARPVILDLVAAFPDHSFENAEAPLEFVRSSLKALAENQPILIGIGPLVTASLRSTHDIIKVCREEISATIVVGGPLCAAPGISAVTKEYLGADFFVAGDGEKPIISIWRDVRSESAVGSVAGVGRPGAPEPEPFREHNLDLLPIPARDLLPRGVYKSSARRDTGYAHMTAAFLSRGCPYSCSFCAAPLSSGKTVRRLSPNRITQEISACGRAGLTNIVFYDDCLFIKSPKLNNSVLEFAEAISLAQWDGTFQLELRCDAVMGLSNEALDALTEAGCRQINMGIEKGQINQLEQLRKRLSPQVAREACERVTSAGIRAAGTFILGGPGEIPEDIEATIDFATSLSLDFAHFNPMAIYPGTPLFNQVFGAANSSKWLELCLDMELAPLGDILWRSSDTPLNLILDYVADGYKKFYTAERLQRTLSRLPEHERHSIEESYKILTTDRAQSWTTNRHTNISVTQLPSC